MIDKAQRHRRTLPPVKDVKKMAWTHPQKAARRPKVPHHDATTPDPMNDARSAAARKAVQRAKDSATSSSKPQPPINAEQEEEEERRRAEAYEATAKKEAAATAKAFLENERIRIAKLEEEEKQAAAEAARAMIRKASQERASNLAGESSTTSCAEADFVVTFGPS